jgi:aminoglycoside phosphotransferase
MDDSRTQVPADNQIPIPETLAAGYQWWRWTTMSCYPRQITWRLQQDTTVRYVKVGLDGDCPGLRAEAERLGWARTYLPVPEVIDVGDGTVEWLVTAGLAGRPATDPALGGPVAVVVAWAEGLHAFHDATPVANCPFDFRLDTALDHVRRRAAAGAVDPAEDFHDDHRHLRTAAAALRELLRHRTASEDLVVCHGDYCPPNALLRGGRVIGYVDLGELAVADRWWDLAVATWSTTWNFGPGLEPLFLAAYGADPDPGRQAFYRLLYDLAS